MTGRPASILLRFVGVWSLSASLGGCLGSYGQFIADSVFDPPLVTQVNGTFGESLEVFSIDTAPDPREVIFFVSGSGCASLRYFLRSYFSGLGGSYRIYAVQKHGVGTTETGLNCSRDFYDRYTHPELLKRNREGLRWVQSQWAGKVAAIIGASEGAEIAAELAADSPDIGKLVAIGGGGMSFRERAFIIAQRRNMETEVRAALARIDTNQHDAHTMVFGMTPRYWASVLDVDPLAAYRRVSQPILLLIGEKDESVPIESALYLKDVFAKEGRRNLTLEVVPGADHVLKRNGSDLRPELMLRIGKWLATGRWDG